MRECDEKIGVVVAQAVHAPSDGGDDKSELRDDTFAQGIADFENGLTQPPTEFGSNPDLLGWWNDGHFFAAQLDEMRRCSGCNNGTGNPCVSHG